MIADAVAGALTHANSIDNKVSSDFQTLMSIVQNNADHHYRYSRYQGSDLPMHNLVFMLPDGMAVTNEAFNDGACHKSLSVVS